MERYSKKIKRLSGSAATVDTFMKALKPLRDVRPATMNRPILNCSQKITEEKGGDVNEKIYDTPCCPLQ
jgi:hypothetical protein